MVNRFSINDGGSKTTSMGIALTSLLLTRAGFCKLCIMVFILDNYNSLNKYLLKVKKKKHWNIIASLLLTLNKYLSIIRYVFTSLYL